MSPHPSLESIQTPYESLRSVVGTVCTSLVHDTPIRYISQVMSHLVNSYNVRHRHIAVLLVLVLSIILYYIFVPVQVDEEM